MGKWLAKFSADMQESLPDIPDTITSVSGLSGHDLEVSAKNTSPHPADDPTSPLAPGWLVTYEKRPSHFFLHQPVQNVPKFGAAGEGLMPLTRLAVFPPPPLSSLLSRSHVGTEPVTARGADTVRRGRVETSRGILSPDAVLSQARDRGRGTGGEGQGERDRDHVRDAHEVGLPEASPLIRQSECRVYH